MVPTLIGDGYLNFGYLGVIAVPFAVAYLYGWGYFRAFRRSHYSVARFLYLLALAISIQVYRDGVPSIITFTLINAAPMMVVVGLHWLFPRRQGSHAEQHVDPLVAKDSPIVTSESAP
jgi:hypothetical protein